MTSLPTGTLTLLFSDIEGSTVLLRRLGPDWGAALSAQRAILRAAFADHDGTEMGTEGDSFFVVFTSAREAVAAAVAAQRGMGEHSWPGGRDVRVRMGLHTGEPQRHEDGYIGEDVHRAARIGSTANGGQVVVSAATEHLVRGMPGVGLRDLGEHRLKDLDGSERLFGVVADGLRRDFPPLRSPGRVAALPAWPTPLVGRDTERRALVELLGEQATRLVVLTGPGGSGKTRLATAVAAAVEADYADGVYFVGLAATRDAAGMWLAVRDALDIAGAAGGDVAAQVTGRLRERNALLLLDNLEQIPDADTVVGALLSAAPRIDVLASSRRPLLLVSEHEFPVDPLSLPTAADLDAVLRAPAVAMFAQQARLARPSFGVTDRNHEAVAAVCRRLDGLPLALELAAAQLRLLSPAALLTRIDGRLGTGFAAADRPDRHRTLADMIAWSYDLLADSDKAVFRRLGVFCADADLDAVAAVAGPDEDGADNADNADNAADILDVVARLVGASMVRVGDGPDGEPRIGMLETIRRFARDRLADAGESDTVRRRHLAWCADVVERTVPMLRGNLHTVALDRLGAIDDDIRAALAFSLDAPSSDPQRLATGQQLLVTVTTRYWYLFGSVAEARTWQERALAGAADDETPATIGLVYGLGISLLQQGTLPESLALLDRALQLARRLEALGWQARILNASAIARRQGGEFAESVGLLRAAIEVARRAGDADLEAKALGNLAVLHHDLGEYPQAVRAAAQSMQVNAARGDDWGVALDRVNYVAAVLKVGGAREAATHFAQWLPEMLAFAETELIIDLLELGGAIASALTEPTVAAHLLGAADTRRAAVGMQRTSAEAGRVDEWVAAARGALPDAQWQAAYASGAQSSPTAVLHSVQALAGRSDVQA